MAELKISCVTANIVKSNAPMGKVYFGTPSVDDETIESESLVTATERFPDAYVNFLVSGSFHGHCVMTLYDKDDTQIEQLSKGWNAQITGQVSWACSLNLYAKDGQAAAQIGSSNLSMSYWVDVATYATGKLVVESSGHYENGALRIRYVKSTDRDTIIDGYNMPISGKAMFSLEIPFTVAAVA
jgi:hypothetical protein